MSFIHRNSHERRVVVFYLFLRQARCTEGKKSVCQCLIIKGWIQDFAMETKNSLLCVISEMQMTSWVRMHRWKVEFSSVLISGFLLWISLSNSTPSRRNCMDWKVDYMYSKAWEREDTWIINKKKGLRLLIVWIGCLASVPSIIVKQLSSSTAAPSSVEVRKIYYKIPRGSKENPPVKKISKVEGVTLGQWDSEVSVQAWRYKGQRSTYFDWINCSA